MNENPSKDEIGGAAPRENSTWAVVATSHFLLLVDLTTREVIPLECDRPEYYGISWFPEGRELVLSHSLVDNTRLTDLSAYALSEVGCLSRGEFRTPPFLSQPHQILCGPDGRVICTNTGRNAISVVDLAKPGTFQEARLTLSRWDRLSLEQTLGDHLNSVFEKNGRLYVIAHRFDRGSVLATLSYPDLAIESIEPIAHRTGLHNIWVTDEGQKIGCHSEAGALVDLNSNSILWEAGGRVYTRGLAASADVVVIGESQHAGREARRSSLSALWLLDCKTWRALDYLCLGPYGPVHEVRLLTGVDQAHHGHPFRGLESLRQRDLRTALAAEKMKAADRLRQTNRAWDGFKLIYGSPTIGEEGARIAEPADPCLFVQAAPVDGARGQLKFRYALLPPPAPAHVSVVLYRGQGGDTDMEAILLQPTSDREASLNLWKHDGTAWKVQAGIGVDGLPLAGEIAAQLKPAGMEIQIDGKRVIQVPWSAPPVGNLGIRWVGSTIQPAARTASLPIWLKFGTAKD